MNEQSDFFCLRFLDDKYYTYKNNYYCYVNLIKIEINNLTK